MGVFVVVALAATFANAEDVTVKTFVRAETDFMFAQIMKASGVDVGELKHEREPVTPANQTVIRSNQDTLYSGVLLDLSEPVMFTLPDSGGRFMSMHVINQDHYMFIERKPGSYELTQASVGTRFAIVIIRTFADATDPEDIKKAHAAQDEIAIAGGGSGPFEAPDWDQEALAAARKSLNDFAILGFDASYAFGRKEETRPIEHLIGAAAAWGGQPRSAAMYVIESVSENDGKTPYAVTAKDVPVNAFWSVTTYNADGYLEANDVGVNSYNDFTAQENPDGSHTIHFGGCEDGRMNCIPISAGWNYTVRMYDPREEIQNGSWMFPEPVPVQ